MVYSQHDIFSRIKKTLPVRWFGEETPVLDTVANCLAAGWVSLFGLLNYTQMQTRISTAFNEWLDLIARDFFDLRIRRRQGETDDSLRNRICMELLRDKCTRAAVHDLLVDLTGRSPFIFEPSNPQDTGCYGSLVSAGARGLGYGTCGGWGNLDLPFQAFVRAYRAEATGIAMVNGWGGDIGGFGTGLSSYISLDMNSAQADDAELYRRVSDISPAATIVWMSVES